MKLRSNQNGFALFEALTVLIVAGLIGVTGWWVYHRNHNTANSSKTASSNSSSVNTSPVAKNVSTAPQVKTADDLDKALQVLDQNDPSSANSSDTTQLDSQTSAF